MANRTFIDSNFSLVKRMVHLFCTISVPEGAPASCAVQKWNYPVFGTGPNVRTYTAAPVAPAASATGPGSYPMAYQGGSEGVLSVTRTAVGKYTLSLQDNYQRLLFIGGHAAGASGTPVFAAVTDNTTITNTAPSSGPAVVGAAFWDFAAAAVDPIGQVRLVLILADASEP